MVAGTVATKENPQTGEKRRKVRFPEKKRLMIPTKFEQIFQPMGFQIFQPTMFCEVVLSRTPSGDLFWDQEGTKCNRCLFMTPLYVERVKTVAAQIVKVFVVQI